MEIDFAARMSELARQPSARAASCSPTRTASYSGPTTTRYRPCLAHVRQLETEDEWVWPADAKWWRGYGMGLPEAVLKKVYALNAVKLLARRR